MSLKINKAKWLNDADSPVVFMIDDLANAWVDINNNNSIEPEEDWGYAGDSKNSSFNYLKKKILRINPKIKTTFFVPYNRAPLIKNTKYNSHFGPIDESTEIKLFFSKLNSDKQFEIAYHGYTHGISGDKNNKFIQEWPSFKSIEEAIETINKGKEKFKSTLGEYPKGGKYCGYESNDFSDKSINESGFLWWCRKWNGGSHSQKIPKSNDLKYFGDNNVIDIPSTIEGNLFNPPKINPFKNVIKQMFGRETVSNIDVYSNGIKYLDWLILNKFVISIQEHISPARTDGKRQTPNIIDDTNSLLEIFTYLLDKNVWYANCTEIAEYFEVFNKTEINIIDEKSFEVKYSGREVENKFLTILLEGIKFPIIIECPDESIIMTYKTDFDRRNLKINKLKIMNGIYKIYKRYELY